MNVLLRYGVSDIKVMVLPHASLCSREKDKKSQKEYGIEAKVNEKNDQRNFGGTL